MIMFVSLLFGCLFRWLFVIYLFIYLLFRCVVVSLLLLLLLLLLHFHSGNQQTEQQSRKCQTGGTCGSTRRNFPHYLHRKQWQQQLLQESASDRSSAYPRREAWRSLAWVVKLWWNWNEPATWKSTNIQKIHAPSCGTGFHPQWWPEHFDMAPSSWALRVVYLIWTSWRFRRVACYSRIWCLVLGPSLQTNWWCCHRHHHHLLIPAKFFSWNDYD